MEPEGSLPHSQEPPTCPYPEQRISLGPRLCIVFRNMVIIYGEELLAPRSTPKLEDHPLSAVRDCIFAATLHIRRPFLHPQPEDAPCLSDRDPLIMQSTGTKSTVQNILLIEMPLRKFITLALFSVSLNSSLCISIKWDVDFGSLLCLTTTT
jgi:hypothetical protein